MSFEIEGGAAKMVQQRPLIPYRSPNADGLHPHQTVIVPAGEVVINTFQARAILMQAVDQNIRFTFSGNPPTATTGFRLVADDPPVILDLIHTITDLRIFGEVAGGTFEYQLLA